VSGLTVLTAALAIEVLSQTVLSGPDGPERPGRSGSARARLGRRRGNSDASLERVAAFGGGWYGFNLPARAVAERVAAPAEQAERP
jgi:hypothetical protein